MRAFFAAAAFALLTPIAAVAQFGPAIVVNDSVVSEFEIDQRVIMLRTFRTPGNLDQLAREQLIEDRLKLEALASAGLSLTDEGLRGAMSDFAGRANLELDQFITVLSQSGVSEETFRDFVRVNVSWRDFIRTRYGDRAQVTEAEIDQALGQSGASSSIEVLLSEIIIPNLPSNPKHVVYLHCHPVPVVGVWIGCQSRTIRLVCVAFCLICHHLKSPRPFPLPMVWPFFKCGAYAKSRVKRQSPQPLNTPRSISPVARPTRSRPN